MFSRKYSPTKVGFLKVGSDKFSLSVHKQTKIAQEIKCKKTAFCQTTSTPVYKPKALCIVLTKLVHKAPALPTSKFL